MEPHSRALLLRAEYHRLPGLNVCITCNENWCLAVALALVQGTPRIHRPLELLALEKFCRIDDLPSLAHRT